jgi:hypothetical protein
MVTLYLLLYDNCICLFLYYRDISGRLGYGDKQGRIIMKKSQELLEQQANRRSFVKNGAITAGAVTVGAATSQV